MNIRGVSILSRRKMIEQEHGAAALERVNARCIERDPFFRTTLLQVSTVPIESFLVFHEVVVEILYANRKQGYLELGEKAGQWSAKEGPSKFLASRGVEPFLRGIGGIWGAHYDGGELVATPFPGGAKLQVKSVPQHPFFELGTLGFVLGGMKVAGAKNVRYQRRSSGGNTDIEYELLFD